MAKENVPTRLRAGGACWGEVAGVEDVAVDVCDCPTEAPEGAGAVQETSKSPAAEKVNAERANAARANAALVNAGLDSADLIGAELSRCMSGC
jgi:hypothetical protein